MLVVLLPLNIHSFIGPIHTCTPILFGINLHTCTPIPFGINLQKARKSNKYPNL